MRVGSGLTWVEAVASGLTCAPTRKTSPALEDDVRFLQLRTPGADRLHLPALEREAGLVPFLDEVVVEGLAILDDAHRASVSINCGRF